MHTSSTCPCPESPSFTPSRDNPRALSQPYLLGSGDGGAKIPAFSAAYFGPISTILDPPLGITPTHSTAKQDPTPPLDAWGLSMDLCSMENLWFQARAQSVPMFGKWTFRESWWTGLNLPPWDKFLPSYKDSIEGEKKKMLELNWERCDLFFLLLC